MDIPVFRSTLGYQQEKVRRETEKADWASGSTLGVSRSDARGTRAALAVARSNSRSG